MLSLYLTDVATAIFVIFSACVAISVFIRGSLDVIDVVDSFRARLAFEITATSLIISGP